MLGYPIHLPQFVLEYEGLSSVSRAPNSRFDCLSSSKGNHARSNAYSPLTDDLGFINPDSKRPFECEKTKERNALEEVGCICRLLTLLHIYVLIWSFQSKFAGVFGVPLSSQREYAYMYDHHKRYHRSLLYQVSGEPIPLFVRESISHILKVGAIFDQ